MGDIRYDERLMKDGEEERASPEYIAQQAEETRRNELLKPKYEELRKKLTAAGYKRETSSFTRGDIYYIITNTADPEDPTNRNKGTLKAVRTMCRELNGISIFDSNQCRLGETKQWKVVKKKYIIIV